MPLALPVEFRLPGRLLHRFLLALLNYGDRLSAQGRSSKSADRSRVQTRKRT
jgi:hypothetical protein